MNVGIKLSALRDTRWHEYLVRFVLGGLMTVFAGAIAAAFGPETGGLFLAFPAIFCASATLIEKHERERKERVGVRGTRRGKEAAALDAAGAALGSLGLLAFAGAIWLLARDSAWLALLAASAAWSVVSVLLWSVRRRIWAVCDRRGGARRAVGSTTPRRECEAGRSSGRAQHGKDYRERAT
jgi:hypothetical protein